MTIGAPRVIVGPMYRPLPVGFEAVAMPRAKPPILPLSALEPGQFADCFVFLAERKPGTTGAGKPFFTCRFRDAGRTATYMVWADGPHYVACEQDWQAGKCY